jgi:hypothetical protein
VSETPAQPDAFGLPHGVMVAGAGAFVMALIAEIRGMSFWDVLKMVWGRSSACSGSSAPC